MPGFFDRLKSGADKAAFEADRLLRLNQAQGAVKAAQRDLEAKVAELGRQALALYDAGNLDHPELQDICRQIEAQREEIAAREAEVERIREEKPPEAGGPPSEQPPEPPTPPSAEPPYPPPAPEEPTSEFGGPTAEARTCPNCGTPLPPDVRFCPECGTKIEEA